MKLSANSDNINYHPISVYAQVMDFSTGIEIHNVVTVDTERGYYDRINTSWIVSASGRLIIDRIWNENLIVRFSTRTPKPLLTSYHNNNPVILFGNKTSP